MVLWFEHDLYDQLQLLDVLALVHSAGAPHETLELVQVGSFPGRPAFRGLGELSADELETLWPQRVPVPPSLLADASAVWDDVRADDPRALAERAVSAIDGMPFLAAALARFVEELPAVRDGLSRTERQLLHVLAAGPQSSGQRVRRLAGARRRAVPRRYLGLPRALGARTRRRSPGRVGGRRAGAAGCCA